MDSTVLLTEDLFLRFNVFFNFEPDEIIKHKLDVRLKNINFSFKNGCNDSEFLKLYFIETSDNFILNYFGNLLSLKENPEKSKVDYSKGLIVRHYYSNKDLYYYGIDLYSINLFNPFDSIIDKPDPRPVIFEVAFKYNSVRLMDIGKNND